MDRNTYHVSFKRKVVQEITIEVKAANYCEAHFKAEHLLDQMLPVKPAFTVRKLATIAQKEKTSHLKTSCIKKG